VSLQRAIQGWSAALFLALALGTGVAALPASTAPKQSDFTSEVPGVPGKTWIDLLSQIFPDIAASSDGEAAASEVNDLRSIGTGDDSWVKCGDNIHFRDRDARPIRLSGHGYVVVTVTIEDECVGLIALFDTAGKLVDAVNVRGDIHTSFSGNYVRPLGADGALVIAHNWHDNSNQSYDSDSLIIVRPDGFSTIGDVLAFGSRNCSGQFTEEAKISLAPTATMARIDVAVSREAHKIAADCKTKVGREARTTFNGYWLWNAEKGAYEPYTKELDLLSDWNEKQF
jgi:hypothetical protein